LKPLPTCFAARIRAYLKQVKSDLFRESAEMDFNRLCRQMNLVEGPDESLWPKNVGLLFFNEDPSQFFPQTQIDVVHFPEGPGADTFSEKIFKVRSWGRPSVSK